MEKIRPLRFANRGIVLSLVMGPSLTLFGCQCLLNSNKINLELSFFGSSFASLKWMLRSLFTLFILASFLHVDSALAVVNGAVQANESHPEVTLLLLAKRKLLDTELTATSLSDFGVCSGAFISDRLVITAGHCFENDGHALYPYLAKKVGNSYNLTAPVASATEYIYEELSGVSETSNGCSPGPKPLPQTKTPDIGLLLFPKNTSTLWFPAALNYQARKESKLSYFGFGTDQDPFSGIGSFLTKTPELRTGSSEVWRISKQRIGFVATVNETFAADGDSGGPVLVDGHLVGVMSTVSERCETEFGEDYAILNTASVISSIEAQSFIKKALEKFNGL